MARYALVIGISKYDDKYFSMLNKAYTDASAVAEVLNKDKRYKYVKVLTDNVTTKKIADTLKEFLQKKADFNEALIYFTGHGFKVFDSLDIEEPTGYIATENCTVTLEDEKITAQKGGLALSALSKLIIQSNLSNLVLLLDACHSGLFLEQNLIESSLQAFSSKTDYCLITACRSSEAAIVKKREKHSVFTGALLEGLSNSNADEQGAVTGDRLFDFIYRDLHKSRQEPIRMGRGRSIVIVQHDSPHQLATIEPIRDDNGDILCPYQGLEVFESEEKEFFFGRKEVTEKIKQSLENTNFVPIIGTSGSGKSSVVRAGLIPWLEEEGNWHILEPIKPGDFPLEELREIFKPFFKGQKKPKQLKELIEKHPQGLIELTKQLPDTKEFLLIVDQFEEVFTVCSDEQERQRFIDLLTQVVTVSDCRLKVVTTMRADFLSSCLDYSKLTQLIQTQNQLMPPLEGANLEAAIVKPAIRQGYRLEKGLIGEIMTDVGKEKGSLPLLEFALTQLWDKRDQGQNLLTLEAYNQIGSLTGALNRHADKIYQYQQDYEEFPGELRDEQQKEWIRRIFLRLVRTGEGTKDTRQRQPKAKLLSTIELDSEKQEQLSELIEYLVKSRLLVTSKDEIDLAHEALIEGWKTFANWLGNSQEIRKIRDKIEDQFEEWKKSTNNDSHLIMGGLLSQVKYDQYYSKLKVELDDEAFNFVNLSIKYEKDQQAERRKILISKEYSEIDALVSLSKAQLSLNDQISSLVTALKASKRTRELEAKSEEINRKVVDALRQVVSTIQERNRFHGHSQQIEDVIFASDYNLVVSSGGDKTVKIWSYCGKLLADLKGHKGWVNSVDIIPQDRNRFLVVSGSSDKLIKIWNVTYQLNEQENSVESVEFECLRDLKGHKSWIFDTAVAVNKQLIASAGKDGTVKIWTISGDLVNTIQVGDPNSEAREVWSVTFSPNGEIIATSGEDRIVKLWDLEGNLLKELRGHEHRVRTVVFSPDGQLIVSGSDDCTMIFWNQNGDIIKKVTDFDGHVNCLRFSRSGSILGAVSDDRTAKLFDLQGNLLKTFKGHQSRVKSLSFSLDDKTLATASWDKTIRLWSLDQQIHTVIKHHTDRVLDVNFSPDGQRLVTGSWDMSACVWDLNGKYLQTLDAHIDKVNGANFSPDGELIVTVGSTNDRTVKVWSSDGCLKQSLQGHEDYIRDPSFSPDGKFIVTAGGDKTVRVWTLNGDQYIEYATLGGENGHTSEVRGVSVSPDSQWIVSGGKDGYIKLWTQDGILVNSLKAHEQEIWNVVFSPDCEEDDQVLMGTASEDRTVKIWKFNQTLENLDPILVLEGHTDRVSDVVFSHCGKLIATGGADKTVRLWSRKGTLLSTLEAHTDRVMAVDFHKNGEFMVSAGVDDVVIIWNIKAQVEMMKLEEENTNDTEIDLSELDKLTQRGGEWARNFIENNQQEVRDEDKDLLTILQSN
ncbi:caspase family protein [Moorena sp. SIO4G3]|uniref:nSTAND1 domain-containing NTPase n=1 Tax=Moorena sp. SIO4G3 TaxID=2607821 RepID=UPI00142CE24C|nr:caspase family protein [Moorena sp. SIO4G3]NEO76511.1 hypothetical protein [Moorena sp. SIO4G3]